MNRMLYTFVIALIGAFIFEALRLPIPWLLGSLIFVFVAQFSQLIQLKWHIQFRNIGLMIVGFSMGHIFSVSILGDLVDLMPFILVSNILIVLFSLLMAFVIHKLSGVPFSTMLVANVPGGLSQMIIFAEETKRMDVAIVTFFQVIRVFIVVVSVPFLVYFLGEPVSVELEAYGWSLTKIALLLFFFLLSWAIVWLAKKVYIPVPFFVGPLLFVIVLKLMEVNVPSVPVEIVHLAQLSIGAYIGLLLKREMINFSKRIIVMGIVSTFILILFTFLMSIPMHSFLDETVISTFLAVAPGGLDQMGIVASSLNENVALVTIFQMFRMLFVFLIVVPILNYLEHRYRVKQNVVKS